jgi:hypothetical protein
LLQSGLRSGHVHAAIAAATAAIAAATAATAATADAAAAHAFVSAATASAFTAVYSERLEACKGAVGVSLGLSAVSGPVKPCGYRCCSRSTRRRAAREDGRAEQREEFV